MSSWMLLLTIAGCVHATGLVVLASVLWTAPEGYQDAAGFHAGRRPVSAEVGD